jgi:hypothetical protein
VSNRPHLAVTDDARVERELAAIMDEVREVITMAMRKRANGRKIEVEIALDQDGYPVAETTKVRPPWHVVGRRTA